MMEERYFTGFCRQTDAARMVEVVTDKGALTEVDCCYGGCPFESSCTIARQIRDLETKGQE